MKVTVSGLYRHDLPGHTEQGVKPYEVSFDMPAGTAPGKCIPIAFQLVRGKDPSADSLKTHKIVWGEENAEPNGPAIEPTGEDSGAGIFE